MAPTVSAHCTVVFPVITHPERDSLSARSVSSAIVPVLSGSVQVLAAVIVLLNTQVKVLATFLSPNFVSRKVLTPAIVSTESRKTISPSVTEVLYSAFVPVIIFVVYEIDLFVRVEATASYQALM